MNTTRFLTVLAAACAFALVACGAGGAASSSASPSPASSAAKPAASRGSAAASSAAASSAKPASSQALVKVKAAFSQISAVQGPMYVAVDHHFFEKYGLDVSLSRVAGTQQVPAMSAGELQFGTPGGNELLSADMAGANIVMIAVNSNYPLFSLYGAKGINSVKDLAGKAVAITTAGSSTDAAAKVYLQHFGLEKQVKLQ
ncbi:MAG: ABC transporter substrate-binding protein, partial [Chloroflexota bacterium]|nr:ABC transporter substrate-binding protein [Chloroflexota bacterium]